MNCWKHRIVHLEMGKKSKINGVLSKTLRVKTEQTLVGALNATWFPPVKLPCTLRKMMREQWHHEQQLRWRTWLHSELRVEVRMNCRRNVYIISRSNSAYHHHSVWRMITDQKYNTQYHEYSRTQLQYSRQATESCVTIYSLSLKTQLYSSSLL